MQNLWAPWRSQFVLNKKEHGCIFCKRLKQKEDRKNVIIHRGEKCFIIMNRFPYNSGHLMVAPIRHIGELEKLTKAEMLELMELQQLCIKLLRKELKPQGFNTGMNLGKVAGAGIANHISTWCHVGRGIPISCRFWVRPKSCRLGWRRCIKS